ncbi:UNVERIFIED_CONTAM: hypothetical protein PYX00_010507 [Menopon gallinae]|uniref:Single domain-containing protein n=1 Tax=Menopon gallinae TaxID=328185 RepID=A0AAW2HGM2_9NEOP
MKSLFLLICLCVLSAECAQQIFLQDENPSHPRKCYNEWEKKYYGVGEEMKRKENSCVKRICSGLVEDTKMQITETSCGFVKAEGQCRKQEGDLKKKYPECCPHVVCPNMG